MGQAVPVDPPFVADVLCYFLLLCLAYLLYQSVRYRRDSVQKYALPHPASKPVVVSRAKAINHINYFIEPSPVVGQHVPYPVQMTRQGDHGISVVVLIRPGCRAITKMLQKIVDYLANNKNIPHEIMAVVIGERDSRHAECIKFAEARSVVRVLHIPISGGMSMILPVALFRTRCELIFVYDPQDEIPFAVLPAFIRKLQMIATRSGYGFVCGNWHETEEDAFKMRSLLAMFCDYVKEYLLATVAKQDTFDCAQSFMVSRPALCSLFADLHITTDSCTLEPVVVARVVGIPVGVLELKSPNPHRYSASSVARLDDILLITASICMYNTGLWGSKTDGL